MLGITLWRVMKKKSQQQPNNEKNLQILLTLQDIIRESDFL